MHYDGRLNLNAKAEFPQNIHQLMKPLGLGKVGQIIQDVTNIGGKVVTYNVGGTMSDPKVTPLPIGLGGR
jgi:hypothetical protein